MYLNEHQRRAYLEALGVDVWLPRETPGRVPEVPLVDSADAPAPGTLGWDALRACVSECTRCVLHRERTQTVFGVGDPSASWMLIGEGPGAEEDRRGEPFVGRAGKLLDEMLRAIGLARECVYIANTVKCRPPGNRSPSLDEAAACRQFLDRQIELVEPAIIIAVGKVAAQNLLGTDEPVGRLRGRRHQFGQIPLVVTYHPAYLLRSPAQKRLAWDDLCLARELVAASVA